MAPLTAWNTLLALAAQAGHPGELEASESLAVCRRALIDAALCGVQGRPEPEGIPALVRHAFIVGMRVRGLGSAPGRIDRWTLEDFPSLAARDLAADCGCSCRACYGARRRAMREARRK